MYHLRCSAFDLFLFNFAWVCVAKVVIDCHALVNICHCCNFKVYHLRCLVFDLFLFKLGTITTFCMLKFPSNDVCFFTDTVTVLIRDKQWWGWYQWSPCCVFAYDWFCCVLFLLWSRVKIYSITVNNTVGGGADHCRECPVSSGNGYVYTYQKIVTYLARR